MVTAFHLRQLAGRLQDEHLDPLERQWHAHRAREQDIFQGERATSVTSRL